MDHLHPGPQPAVCHCGHLRDKDGGLEVTVSTAERIATFGVPNPSPPRNKRAVVSLVERGGKSRTFHVDHATAENVRDVIVRNVSRKSKLHTDESKLYVEVGTEFAKHETVKHSANEYVRGDVHTNTVEGFFSIFKRGMKGVYQHCGEAHLHRYVAEFDFRYSNRSGLGVEDTERAAKIIYQASGKRLTYRAAGRA